MADEPKIPREAIACKFPLYTDIGFGQRLAREQGELLRYCLQTGWLHWTGSHWKRDETGSAKEAAKTIVRRAYRDLANIKNDEFRKKCYKEIVKAEAASRVRGILDMAECEKPLRIAHDQLDSDPWVFNCTNGTTDLRTGETRKATQSDLITRCAGVAYDPAAKAPTWLSCMNTWMGENPEVVPYLQIAVGYCLTGITREQCLHVMYGHGANGKSTFVNTILAMLGDYATQADAGTIMLKRDDKIRNDVARLAGVRFVGVTELEDGQRLAESLVKSMTGGDRIVARFLFHEDFEYTPQFKLWLSGNHLPQIRGTDHAIWRRIRLIPFTVTIPEEDRDLQLPAKLRDELPGILNWALEGCRLWQRDGLNPPESVMAATGQYREEQDTLAIFIADCCTVSPNMAVQPARLYDAYVAWAGKGHTMSQTAFGRRLEERGFVKRKTGGRLIRVGLGLANDSQVGAQTTF